MNESNAAIQDPYVLTLSKPIVFGNERYEQIILTEPTAGQVEEANRAPNPAQSNILLVAAVAGIPEFVVRRIPYRDFSKAVEYLENFFGDGRKTGRTS